MKIGSEELAIEPESKRALDIEITLWSILVYVVVFLYALDYVSLPVFFVLFYLSYARFFMGNHDRMHAVTSRRLPRLAESIAEHFRLVVTPWVEPYDSIRRKHMRHHATHRPGKTPVLDTRDDPHSALEMGGFLRAFLSSMFVEEVQLFFDVRDGEVTKSRWVTLIIYLPLQILFLMAFGWEKYLVVLLAARLSGGFFYFIFSWGFHRRLLYRFGVVNEMPAPFFWMFRVGNGKRTGESGRYHASHHAWPGVPSRRLHEFDSAVLRTPDAAPEMIPSG